MYEVEITRDFSAAHNLRGYQGNCSHLHGHNWTVQAVVRARELDAIGIAVDFRKLKNELNSILETFDHTNISELECFRQTNPTSENLARIIYQRLTERINDERVQVARVKVCESAGSGATYFEEE